MIPVQFANCESIVNSAMLLWSPISAARREMVPRASEASQGCFHARQTLLRGHTVSRYARISQEKGHPESTRDPLFLSHSMLAPAISSQLGWRLFRLLQVLVLFLLLRRLRLLLWMRRWLVRLYMGPIVRHRRRGANRLRRGWSIRSGSGDFWTIVLRRRWRRSLRHRGRRWTVRFCRGGRALVGRRRSPCPGRLLVLGFSTTYKPVGNA
jgi:hypothetical protein